MLKNDDFIEIYIKYAIFSSKIQISYGIDNSYKLMVFKHSLEENRNFPPQLIHYL